MRAYLLPLFASSLSLAACVDHTSSSLVGSMSLTVTAEGGAAEPVRVDGPPGKLRAQVSDSGTGCKFSVEVEDEGGAEVLTITTYADQVEDLIAGKAQDLPAVDNADRAIGVGAATVYFTHGDEGYSKTGMLHVGALPKPPANVHITLEGVELAPLKDSVKRVLQGTIDATYIGATVLDATGKRACPSLAEVPKGLVF